MMGDGTENLSCDTALSVPSSHGNRHALTSHVSMLPVSSGFTSYFPPKQALDQLLHLSFQSNPKSIMPTVSVSKLQLFDGIGRSYTDEEFDQLCFDLGLELDDIVSEQVAFGGRVKIDSQDASNGSQSKEHIVYKIDVPANRYDLLCLEGLVQAIRVFLEIDPVAPTVFCSPQEPRQQMIVEQPTKQIRPFVVCAILNGISMTPAAYQSLIDLQEKLHQNICRKRSLVAIGTHDLSKLKGPFRYTALPPKDIKFVALGESEEMDAVQLFTYYEKDMQLKKYLPLIRDSPVYPVIYDSNNTVLSLPPIINGNHSKINLDTKDIFIECTATDLTKAKIVLNILVSMFSRYCKEPFSVEPVQVVYEEYDSCDIFPDLAPPSVEARVEYINSLIGVDLSSDEMLKLLNRMQLPGKAIKTEVDGEIIQIEVPITRRDILHACDIAEDIGVAYGFNNVEEKLPTSATTGRQQPLNYLSDLIRREGLAQQGFTEVLTWVTVSNAENFDMMLRKDDSKTAVKIGNPKTLEFQECRTWLLPGILKTLRENRKLSLPIRLFEVGDVVRLDPASEVGARNHRSLAAVYCGMTAGFEVMKGLVDHLMMILGYSPGAALRGEKTYRLSVNECVEETFFPKRRANIIAGGTTVGVVGWIHPKVLENFSLVFPCSALELDIEFFL